MVDGKLVGKVDYVLVNLGGKISNYRNSHKIVLIYEKPGKPDSGNLAVGFLDGHVELVTSERLQELLEADPTGGAEDF